MDSVLRERLDDLDTLHPDYDGETADLDWYFGCHDVQDFEWDEESIARAKLAELEREFDCNVPEKHEALWRDLLETGYGTTEDADCDAKETFYHGLVALRNHSDVTVESGSWLCPEWNIILHADHTTALEDFRWVFDAHNDRVGLDDAEDGSTVMNVLLVGGDDPKKGVDAPDDHEIQTFEEFLAHQFGGEPEDYEFRPWE